MYEKPAIAGRAILVVALGALVSWGNVEAQAQEPFRMVIGNVSGHVGQLVEIPFYVLTQEDSLDGFQIQVSLSVPDLMYFEVDTVIFEDDTSFVCDFDTTRTLTSGWETINARSTLGNGLDLRLMGMSSTGGEDDIPGIPDSTQGVLLRVFGRIRGGLADSLTNRTVYLYVGGPATYYSNEIGDLIDPVENVFGSVTVLVGEPGDVNCDGSINPLDVVFLVNYVYMGWDMLCLLERGDLTCEGQVNPIDVTHLVNFVYNGWPIPPCE